GMAEGARTTFQQDGTWYVRGPENRVYVLTGRPQNEIYGSDTDFTSCELPEPHYTFNAGSLKMVENDVMVARDVTLRFQDVPVFWLPWLIQSMKDGRRSGLLMPEFGINDIVRTGSSARSIENLGFYWAMNDYVSARGTFGWLSDNWKSLEGAVTYRWLRQFLNGSLSLRHYWRDSGRRDLTIGTNNSWQPDERTQLTVAGNFASSTAFVRDNSFDPRELNRSIVMNGSARRRFDWGNVTLGTRRTQRLSDERVELMLPRLSVSISPITLFSSPSGTNSMTWSGSGDVNRRTTDVLDTLPGGRDNSTLRAGFGHRLGYGRFNVSQDVDWSEDRQMFKPALNPAQCFLGRPGAPCVALDEEGNEIAPDSALPETLRQELTWSTSTGYQQDLWTGTTLTPRIRVGGRRLKTDGTGGTFVAEPIRTSVGADLNTSIYGFWPGVGPFSRIRHKISPRLSWSYSPTPGETTALQDSVFGLTNLRESNRLQLSFNQTFEAKYADSDTVSAETVAEEGGGLPAQDPVSDGEPRRLPQARKTTLLSINTSTPLTYDFVSRREEGRGFLTDEIRNSIRSDILRGLQLNTTHDLFREETLEEGAAPGTEPERTFAPFLTRLTTSFSIDQDFWLFRVLGLSGGPDPDGTSAGREEAAEGTGAAVDPDVGAESEPSRAGRVGSLVPGTRSDPSASRAEVGGWRASLNYTLDRRRPESNLDGSQTLSGNFSFSPTSHWSVNWSTAYSFTDQDFQYHTLRLTRDLHRWQANFDFSKAQNGNFIFRFRVTLLDNPDLEFDYDQHSGTDRSGFRPQP
ncbi:MAG TPA: putative LPS assembly protein LptD, partial [Longimicrobiales bacterium]|nr:putative LPS assembly protein LptD [Longimicrobiales bacterium]